MAIGMFGMETYLHSGKFLLCNSLCFRFADVRNTLQGKLEERLPFFSFAFPDAFKKRYHKEYIVFRNNLNRLVTPFDVHETFLDILREW